MEVLDRIIQFIVNPAILLVFSLGFLLFMWGLVVFIANPEDMAKRKTGIQHMIWGVVGMFIMVAVGGIINIVVGTFDLQLPGQFPASGGSNFNTPSSGFPTL
jgi:hypothetical protein